VAKFRYLRTTVTNRILIHEAITSRLILGSACYCLLQNLLSSRLLSLHREDVYSVADVFEVLVATIFRVEVSRASKHLCTYIQCAPNVPRRMFSKMRKIVDKKCRKSCASRQVLQYACLGWDVIALHFTHISSKSCGDVAKVMWRWKGGVSREAGSGNKEEISRTWNRTSEWNHCALMYSYRNDVAAWPTVEKCRQSTKSQSTVKVRTFTAVSFQTGAGLVAHTLEYGCVSQSARAAMSLG
jgi:hypothetical protein